GASIMRVVSKFAAFPSCGEDVRRPRSAAVRLASVREQRAGLSRISRADYGHVANSRVVAPNHDGRRTAVGVGLSLVRSDLTPTVPAPSGLKPVDDSVGIHFVAVKRTRGVAAIAYPMRNLGAHCTRHIPDENVAVGLSSRLCVPAVPLIRFDVKLGNDRIIALGT